MFEEKLLLVAYLYLAGRSGLDANWWKCLYWAGAFVVTLAIVYGVRK